MVSFRYGLRVSGFTSVQARGFRHIQMCGYVQNLLSGGDDGVAIRGRSYGAAGGNQDCD